MSSRKGKRKLRKKLSDVLWHFNKAISIVETAHHALERVDDNPEIGDEVVTLRAGLDALHAVHEELDRAIPAEKS